jgi:cell division protein FtsB
MGRWRGGTTLLFWLMFLLGGGSLFACLFLPVWLEARALREEHAAAQQRVTELEEHLTSLTKQIQHLQDDPAYLERLARREFGIETPGIEMIWIDAPGSATQPTSAPTVANVDHEEALAARIERAARTNPLVAVFVLDATRPVVMTMSAILLLVALVFLARPPGR